MIRALEFQSVADWFYMTVLPDGCSIIYIGMSFITFCKNENVKKKFEIAGKLVSGIFHDPI